MHPHRVRRRFALSAGIVIAALVVGALYLRSTWFLSHIRPFVEGRVSSSLQFPVSIGALTGTVFGDVQAQNIVVADPGFADPMLTIRSLRLRFDVLPLLRRVVRVHGIELDDVMVALRRERDAPFNLERAIANATAPSPGAEPSQGFDVELGDVSIRNGTLALVDRGSEARLNASGIQIVSEQTPPLDIEQPRSFSLTTDAWAIELGSMRQQIASATASGKLSPQAIHADAITLRVGQSRVGLRGDVALTPIVALSLVGDATIQLADVRDINPTALAEVSGTLIATSLRLADDPADVALSADLTVEDAAVGDLALPKITAGLSGRLSELRVASIAADWLNGTIRADVEVTGTESGFTEIEASADRIDIEAVRQVLLSGNSSLRPLTGRLSGNLRAELRDSGIASVGTWRSANASWGGRRFDEEPTRIRHEIRGDTFSVSGDLAGMTVEATGDMPQNGEPLNVRVTCATPEVASAARVLGFRATGPASADARVSGDASSPQVTFAAQWQGTANGALPVAGLNARGEWSDNRLTLTDARLASSEGEVRVTGTVEPPNGKTPARIRLSAESHAFDLAPYVHAFAPGVRFTGSLDGSLALEGFIDRLSGSGSLSPKRISVDDVGIAVQPVEVVVADGKVSLPELRASAGDVAIIGRAAFDAERYGFTLGLDQPTALEQIAAALPERWTRHLADAHGILEFEARADAAYAYPTVSATASLDDARYRTADLGDSLVNLLFDGKQVYGRGTLMSGAFDLDADASLEADAIPVRAVVQARDADLLPLIRLAGTPAGKGWQAARIAGDARVTGDLRQPKNLAADVNLDSVRFSTERHALASTQPVRGRITSSGVELGRFALASEDPESPFDVLAEGLIDWSRPLDFSVDARVFNLATVADFMGFPDRISGAGTYRLRVQGTTREPIIETEWTIPEAMLTLGTTRPPLAATNANGRLTYADKVIRIERTAFRVGSQPFEVAGQVPLDLSFLLIPLIDRVVDAPIDVRIRSPKGDAAWLAALEPSLASISGTASLDLRVTGTLEKPIVQGSAALKASSILPKPLSIPATNVLASVAFDTVMRPDGSRDVRARLDGSAGLGQGSFAAIGEIAYPLDADYLRNPLDASRLRTSVTVTAQDVSLADWTEALAVPDVPLSAVADATLRVTGEGVDPKTWRAELRSPRLTVGGGESKLTNRDDIAAEYDGEAIHVRRFVLADGDRTAQLDGNISLPQSLDLRLALRDLDIALFRDAVPGKPTLMGALSGGLSVSGTPEEPRFRAEWQLGEAKIGTAAVDAFAGKVEYDGKALALGNWDIASYGSHLLVQGSVPLSIGSRPSQPFVRATDQPVDVTIRTDAVQLGFLPLVVPAVEEASGTAGLDLRVGGTSSKPLVYGSGAVTNASLRLRGNDTPVEQATCALNATGDAIVVDDLSFRVRDASYSARNTRLALDGLRPVSLNTVLSFVDASLESWMPTASQGSTTTRATGDLSAQIDLRSALASASAESDAFDRFVAAARNVTAALVVRDMTADASGYHIVNDDALVARLQKNTLELGSMTRDAWDALRSEEPSTWLARILPQPLSPLVVRHFGSPTRELLVRLRGTSDLSRSMNVEVSGRIGTHYLNEWIVAHLPRPEDAPVPTLKGGFRFDARLSGTERAPRLALSASAENLQMNSVAVQDLSLLVTYANRALSVEQGRFLVSGSEVRVGGDIPFELSPLNGKVGVLDRDFQLQLDSDLRNFDFVPALFPAIVQRADGTGTAHITLGGRLEAPLYQGSIQVRNLALDMPSNYLFVSDASADLTLHGDVLELQPGRQVTGLFNGGRFAIDSARLNLEKGMPKSVDLRGSIQGVTFYQPGEYRTTVDATARIVGPLDHVVVRGDVMPKNVRYEQDWREFVTENLSAMTRVRRKAMYNVPILRGMELDVGIQAERDVVVDTGVGEIEARVDGRVFGLVSEPVFVGEVAVLTGEFSYLGNRFRIDSGQVTSTDAGVFDPEYTVVATTVEPLRNVRIPDGQGRPQVRDVRVQVTLRGRLEQGQPPEFAATVLNRAQGEEFPLDTQQGISLLTFGDATLIAQGSDTALSTAGQNLLKEGAESYLGGRFARVLGLRTLDVDVASSGIEGSRFSLTKDVSSRFAITYASTLQLDQEQRVEVEYTVNDNLAFIGERNEQGKYGVDLKFSHEFR